MADKELPVTEEMKLSNAVRKVLAKKANVAEVEGLLQRIDEMGKKLNAPHECPGAKVRTLPVARQYTGRVTMPSYGIPLPAGVGFHGYVNTRLEDDQMGDQVVPPSEGDVLAILRTKAAQKFPGFVDVEVADISILPEGWNETASEEE